ncbi:fibronectin type III domain-containing protein [Carboxylicivirga marina]|uniref:Fibronectin type-III domain-containing protein n=1 Tax=Carboxylicivirga marina TaxID=2800988 RepID=A0ABS1HHI8_9BACT|nr:hypothetical protein [Carboxylicivirga marina]MBK3517131.1 hypothetical protein [Carboxylicivirga marina]
MQKQLMIFGLMVVLFACEKSEDANLAPNIPVILNPAEGTTCELLRPSFTWEASDPEEDELTYTIWLGTEENQLSVESANLQHTRYTPTENLAFGTIYYCQIEAHDAANSTKSEVVSFSTTGEGESGVLPSRPVVIAPKTNILAGDIAFSWNESTHGVGTIVYDLYVQQGEASEFSLLEAEISGTASTHNITAGKLSWYVEAKDSRGQVARSSTISITLN